MKRKQPDFQKVKFKVGKHLPKGRNETKTSFQTRKILVPTQLKAVNVEPTLKELLKNAKSRDVQTRCGNLKKLSKYVSDNKSTLNIYFPEILPKLGPSLVESNSNVRLEVIKLLSLCCEYLTINQFKSFSQSISYYLYSMMTKGDYDIRRDSLKFVANLLQYHPNIICKSSQILHGMLFLIASRDHTRKKWKLIDRISSKMTADEMRIEVFNHIHLFLFAMLQNRDTDETDADDQKEVRWEAKKPLKLKLYQSTGTEPNKLDLSWYSQATEEDKEKSFVEFLFVIIPLISDALQGRILTSGTPSSSTEEPTKCIMTQLSAYIKVLCCIGELVTDPNSIYKKDLLENPACLNQLEKIVKELLIDFPYIPVSNSKKAEELCMKMNIEICYLYSLFVVKPGKQDSAIEKDVFSYLASICSSCTGMSNENVTRLLKSFRIFMYSNEIKSAFKNEILHYLYHFVDLFKFQPMADSLYSFMMDISMDYDLRFLLSNSTMDIWFKYTLRDLRFMSELKINKPKFLRYVKQLSERKYPAFIKALEEMPSLSWMDLLLSDFDKEFQLTIAALIATKEKIPPDLLQLLSENIRDEFFPVKVTLIIIRILFRRFNKSDVPPIDQLNYVKFLLNLSCDTFAIADTTLESKALPFVDEITDIQRECCCHFQIYPSRYAKRHLSIFEECIECLIPFIKNDKVMRCILYLIKETLTNEREYPVHSVIAFLELRKRIPFIYNNLYLNSMMHDLIISSLVYMSKVTNDIPENKWMLYSVAELQDSFGSIKNEEVFIFMEGSLNHFKNDECYYHSLRILMFLIKRNFLLGVDKNSFYLFFDKLGNCFRATCEDPKLYKAMNDMWLQIINLY
ncbi:testis-expressed protein 10 [Caerostris darwini]|uniref:Testis-expressed protein 10 n=1 Tax=Caerostris darwini TaxID=1538125 RepID=A0AAV4TBG3_9ARAC|nr:testis-expressed protein 10 [Caerostris darwini]